MELETVWSGDVHGPHRGSLYGLTDPSFAEPTRPAPAVTREPEAAAVTEIAMAGIRRAVFEALGRAALTVEELAATVQARKVQVQLRALRAIGVEVRPISGEGVPDLLCGFRNTWTPVEVKRPRGHLTPAQKALRARVWFPVVETVEEALALFGVKPKPQPASDGTAG